MHRISVIIKGLIFFIWIVVSGYLGLAGYTFLNIRLLEEESDKVELARKDTSVKVYEFRNKSFTSKEKMKVYQEEINAASIFPTIILDWPDSLIFILTSCSFGVIGALTAITKSMAIDNVPISEIKVVSEPLLGMFTGIVILGVANLIPYVLLNGDAQIKPLSLAFFSLLAGLSRGSFYSWTSSFFDRFLNKIGGEESSK